MDEAQRVNVDAAGVVEFLVGAGAELLPAAAWQAVGESGRAAATKANAATHDDLAKIKGAKSGAIADLLGYDFGPEVVHRNNLALM